MGRLRKTQEEERAVAALPSAHGAKRSSHGTSSRGLCAGWRWGLSAADRRLLPSALGPEVSNDYTY